MKTRLTLFALGLTLSVVCACCAVWALFVGNRAFEWLSTVLAEIHSQLEEAHL